MASEEPVEFTINRLERVTDKESSKYLVYADGLTMQITDSLLFRRFDSSDLYGRLEEGGSYVGRKVGWRVPILSMYPNLLSATESDN
jgi:hypothetical protein